MTVTSSDGLLQATLKADFAGALLFFTGSGASTPETVAATNYFSDPGFESASRSGWPATANSSRVTLAVDTAQKRSGSQSLKVTTVTAGTANPSLGSAAILGGTPESVGFANGDSVTFSAWAYVPTANSAGMFPELRIDGAAVTTIQEGAFSDVRDSFVQLVATTTFVDVTQPFNVYFYVGQAAGDTVWFADIGLTKGTSPVSFNGSTAADTFSYRWVGTPLASFSQQYTPGVDQSFPTTASVRFYRADNSPVRSGSPAAAIGGQAVAYDNEAPLGGTVSWFAAAYDDTGTLLVTTETVSLDLPTTPSVTKVWMKSINDPTLDVVALCVGGVPALTYAARQNVSNIVGASAPFASFDKWQSSSSDWQFWVDTPAEREALLACLMSGPVQVTASPRVDFPQMVVLAGDITRTYGGSVQQTGQTVTATLTEVAPPGQEAAPLMIPGRSWRELSTEVATWQDVLNTYDSALQLVDPDAQPPASLATWQALADKFATWQEVLDMFDSNEQLAAQT